MPYQNNAFFLECANSLPAGAYPQTSLGILQRFHRHLKLNMTGIEIWSTVADPGTIAPSNGGLVVSTPAWDGTGCEFNSWQCRIYIPCSLSLRLLGSLLGSWVHKNCVEKKKKKFQSSAKLLFPQFQSLKIWTLRQYG